MSENEVAKKNNVVPLAETIGCMQSDDYKKRFSAEYHQVNTRLQNLERFLEDYRWGRLDFEPACSLELLTAQYNAMYHYRSILEERSAIEEIIL